MRRENSNGTDEYTIEMTEMDTKMAGKAFGVVVS